jgi:hypothetical protein
VFLLLKEVLFGAGGVTLVSFGVLAVHWNIREVVAYKTGVGKKVRVVKGVAGTENREIRQTNKLEPVGKVQFSVAGVESAEQGGTKLEVAQEESYIYTQAVVGGLDEAIQGMLDKQDTDSSKEAVVVDVATGLLEDIDVDVYEGTNVLVDETELNLDDSTQVLVDNEQDVVEEDVVEEVEIDDISESTDVLADLDDSTQVLDNDTTDDSEDYFTEVLDAEPQVEDVEITQALNDNGLGSEYLTQVLVDDSDVVGIEDDFDDTLEDVELEYVTQVLNEVDNSSDDAVEVLEDDAYITQVLVDGNDEVDYNTQVLVDAEDYNTQVLVDSGDYDTQVLVEDLEGHTQVLDNEGITGDIIGAKVETIDLVKVENMKVIYTNYEMEDK